MVNIAILTVSDSRTEENDKSGQSLVEFVQQAGSLLRSHFSTVTLINEAIPLSRKS